MPELDVSFLVADPMLSDTFSVVRRADAVSAKGRTSAVTEQVFEGIAGVVTQRSPNDLDRKPDGQSAPRRIFIATQFQLYGPVGSPGTLPGYQPDIVRWNGTDYLVVEIEPYSRFGGGTYQVKAESMTQPDSPQ